MSEETERPAAPKPMIKVIRIETPTCTITKVTKPTTIPPRSWRPTPSATTPAPN